MSHHVLVIGGHGKIAQLLTPLLLQRSWTVTSMVRTAEQVPTIEALGAGKPGKLNVLVSSIEDVTSKDAASKILKDVKPDLIAFSAGAGGKGDPSRTFKIDRDAASHFINAAADIETVKKFLLVSYIGSRRQGASWWPEGAWDKYMKEINEGVLANYYKAKVPADELLYETGKKSKHLSTISLRPGMLTEEKAGGVLLGKTPKPSANASRELVAKVIDEILSRDKVETAWLDMYDGESDVKSAVDKAIAEKITVTEGEPIHKL